MKVSIIIPVHNVEKYILGCLNSVANQTMKEGIECILVDDCGTDNSMLLAKDWVSNYNGIVGFSIKEHDNNRGLSAARNTGIDAAKGEYMFFLDSDDELKEGCLEKLYSLAQKHGGVDIVQGAYDTEYPYMQKFKDSKYPEYTDDSRNIKSSLLDYDYMPTMAQNRLVKRELIINNKLYFKEGIIHEDMHWSYFLAKHVKTMCFCNTPTYFYRVTPGSITSNINKEKKNKALRTIISDFSNNIDDYLVGSQKTVILNHLLSYLGMHLYSDNKEKDHTIQEFRKTNTLLERILLRLYLLTKNNKILHLLIRIYNRQ